MEWGVGIPDEDGRMQFGVTLLIKGKKIGAGFTLAPNKTNQTKTLDITITAANLSLEQMGWKTINETLSVGIFGLSIDRSKDRAEYEFQILGLAIGGRSGKSKSYLSTIEYEDIPPEPLRAVRAHQAELAWQKTFGQNYSAFENRSTTPENSQRYDGYTGGILGGERGRGPYPSPHFYGLGIS